MLMVCGLALFEQYRWSERRNTWLRSPALLSTAAWGLALSGGAAYFAHEMETHTRRESFEQVAGGLTSSIATSMLSLRDHDLADLAHFFESSENVTESEFTGFVESLVKGATVRNVQWAPRVPASDPQSIGIPTPSAGVEGLRRSDDSVASDIDAGHYPTLYIEPRAGNESMLGVDVGRPRRGTGAGGDGVHRPADRRISSAAIVWRPDGLRRALVLSGIPQIEFRDRCAARGPREDADRDGDCRHFTSGAAR